jgi:hypothetical protein
VEAGGYNCELINIQGGIVTANKGCNDDIRDYRGDKNLDNNTVLQELSPLLPSHIINDQQHNFEQNDLEVKSTRGLSPVSHHVPLKNSIASELASLNRCTV